MSREAMVEGLAAMVPSTAWVCKMQTKNVFERNTGRVKIGAIYGSQGRINKGSFRSIHQGKKRCSCSVAY